MSRNYFCRFFKRITGTSFIDYLNKFRISKMYIRGEETQHFEAYVHAHMDKIVTDPTVPSKVKAATFYLSSIHALRKAFDDPNAEEIEEIKKALKPMFKSIFENKVLLEDLFSGAESRHGAISAGIANVHGAPHRPPSYPRRGEMADRRRARGDQETGF